MPYIQNKIPLTSKELVKTPQHDLNKKQHRELPKQLPGVVSIMKSACTQPVVLRYIVICCCYPLYKIVFYDINPATH